MCFLEVNESTGQRVVEGTKIRNFEFSRIRFFSMGVGEGVKKSRKEAGWGASFLLGDLFEVIFFFFS